MADRIKGITIEIGGDTTGLRKALSGVNSEIKNTQTQLKDVEKLLKLDPTNTELLKQKQKLLTEAVSETKEKLDTLKKAEKQVQEQFEQGKVSQEQYDALKREIADTERQLKSLEEQAANSNLALKKIGEVGETLQKTGDKITSVGKALLPVTTAVTAIGTAAVKTTADFDAAMSQVSAVSGAAGDDFDRLRDKAREMGAKTKFSAEEAAEAMNYMAMAGWKTEDMLSGIEGIMNLAAASGENLGTTSDIVTDALTAFGLTAKDSGHFADILAAASSNANTNVSMLGDSFRYVAPLAGSMGYSAEDVSIALGMMANSGIKASQAGTAMRSILTRLAKPTKESANAMEALDLSITDASGNMKPFMEIMEDMRTGFAGLTEEEKAFYAAQLGGQQAMSGLLAIVNSSENDFTKLTNAVYACDGVTQKMADTMQDNLSGQLTILQSQLQEAAISIGDALMPKIRELVGKIQEWTDWFNNLDDAQKELIIEIGLVAAAIGPLLIVIGQIASGVGAVLTAISTLGPVLTAFSATGGPILLAVAAIGLLVTAMCESSDGADAYAESLSNLTPEQEANKKSVDELSESYRQLEEKRNNASETIQNQANMENLLWEELRKITDENGNVSEGYEERAKVITEQLSEALGTEIELTGDQIQNYKELCTNIDELIRKKQANALLDANEAGYIEALSKQTDAYMAYNQAKKDLEETTWQMLKAQEEEEKVHQKFTDLLQESIETGEDVTAEMLKLHREQQKAADATKGLSEKVSELNQTYSDAQTAYVGYNTTIANYEGLAAAIVSNDQAEISDAVLKTMNNFLTAETGTRESLTRQVDEFQVKYQEMKAAVEAGAPGITSVQVENMEKLVSLSREELDKLPAMTGDSVSESADVVREKASEMDEAGTNVAKGLAKGIKAGSKDVEKAADQMAKDSIDELKTDYDINSPSKVTEEIGLYVAEGLQTGIEQGMTGALSAVEEMAAQTVESLETDLSKEKFISMGKQVSAGLSEGIALGKSDVLASVLQMCEETISTAKNSLGIHSPSTEFSYMGQMSGEGFVEGWNGTVPGILDAISTSIGQTVAEMKQTFEGIDTALLTLRDSSGNVIAGMVKDAKEAQEALVEIQSGLGETISGQVDIFSEFGGQAKLSTEELLGNMQSQVEGTEQWAENLRILAERGIDQGLLQKMAEMGPKGAGYVTTFSQMTDEQLRQANALFKQSMVLPETTAESIMQSYKVAGQMTAQGFGEGITENTATVANSSSQLANEAIMWLQETLEINSPSRVTAEVGQYFSAGFAEGITEGTEQVTEAVENVTNAATAALNNNLNLSKGNFSTYKSEISSSWNTWAAGLAETLKSTLNQINTETSNDMQKMKTTVATSVSDIETNWKKQLEEIRKDHEKTMTDVNAKTAETMAEMSETVGVQTEQMKEDTITAMEEMVIGIAENMDEIEPTIRDGFKPGIDYITSLISEARIWGNDMMQGLIQGLEDYLDELEDVCEDIADTISDNLHFTRPERGSLRDYETWMPHFMQGLAKGIADNKYLVIDQIKNLTDNMCTLQGANTNMPVINLTNRSVLMLEGKQIAEAVDVYLGGDYG